MKNIIQVDRDFMLQIMNLWFYSWKSDNRQFLVETDKH